MLHDIGKLAVPEHILSKPGQLTQEEFQKIRIHPQVGAEIIAAVPFPYPVAPLILSHHERWDGKGYPQGLAGDEIPIGARILTIVDYYDAVTTERPYHKALSSDSAIGLLRHEAGRALDPVLVPLFIEMLPDCWPPQPPKSGGALRRATGRADRRRSSTQPGSAGGEPERVREHRARAPRDLRALRDRAVDGHQPRRGRHDGAHLVEAGEARAVVADARCSCYSRTPIRLDVPVRERRRRAAAAQHHAARSDKGWRAGWRATAGRSSTPTRASRSRPPASATGTQLQLGDRLPAVLERLASSAAWRCITRMRTTTPKITAG